MESARITAMRDRPVRSEDRRGDLRGSSVMSPPRDEITGDAEARNDFWPIQGVTFIVFTSNLEFSWFVLKEQGTLSIPLKHIDMTRATHPILDVLQESRVDNYWNIDVNRNLSVSWTGFTTIEILKERLPEGQIWASRRFIKIQATT